MIPRGEGFGPCYGWGEPRQVSRCAESDPLALSPSENGTRLTIPDGWKVWLDWHRAVAPDNAAEIKAIEEDGGRYIGYVRVVGRRGEAKLEEYNWHDTLRTVVPPQYTEKPLLRSQVRETERKEVRPE